MYSMGLEEQERQRQLRRQQNLEEAKVQSRGESGASYSITDPYGRALDTTEQLQQAEAVQNQEPVPFTGQEQEPAEQPQASAEPQPDVLPDQPEATQPEEEEEDSGTKILDALSPSTAAKFAVGMGVMDTIMDAVDTLIGPSDAEIAEVTGVNPDDVNSLKKLWDKITQRKDSRFNGLRKISAEVIPAIYGGSLVGRSVTGLKISQLSKGALIVAGENAVDQAIIEANDDVAQQDNAARAVADAMPGVFGPKGYLPLPDRWKTLDGDSPEIRKLKNQREAVGLNIVGNVVGFLAQKGINPLNWILPQDKVAQKVKERLIRNSADPDTQAKILEIDLALETNPSEYSKGVLNAEKRRLLKQLEETGTTEVNPKTPLENYLEKAESTQINQIDDEAIQLLEAGPAYYEPRLMPGLAKPGSNAVQSIPPMNVLRNMADVSYLKATGTIGDPAPVVTNAFIKNANIVGKQRKAILGLAESSREVYGFDAVINGFRQTQAGMSNAPWKIYRDVMDPTKGPKELANLFFDDRATQVLLDGTKVSFLNEVQNLGVELAIRDLMDLYLGRQTTESSARIMDTFAREITSFAQGANTFAELADNNQVQELVLDKLEFLMAEQGLNKYISGWMLNNKGILSRLKGKSDDAYELAQLIKDEFDTAVTARGKKIKEFRENIEIARRENPRLLAPLMDAYSHSDGDITSIVALKKWVDKQLSFKSLFFNSDAKMNMFASELWSVRYNNVLSGLAATRALVGNSAGMAMKMASAFTQAALYAPKTEGESFKKFGYLYGSLSTTINLAVSDGIKRARQVHKDPDAWLEAIRKDYRVADESEKWKILEGIEEGGGLDFGQQFELNLTRGHHNMSKNAVMRWGTTAMAGLDAMTDTFMGVLQSRVRAYEDIFVSKGIDYSTEPEIQKALMEAEKLHYSKMFDKNGVLTDEAAKFASGEIALNLDSTPATWINQGVGMFPILKSLLMFPRTSVNYIKLGLSGIPFFPGKVTKAVKTDLQDTEKVKEVLALHGIPFDGNPYALAQFKQIKEEYIGRWYLSAMAAGGLYMLANQGMIRGNGPQNYKEAKYLRENFGWQPTSVKLAGTDRWIPVQGIPIIEPLVNIIGDISMYQENMSQNLIDNWFGKIAWTLSATYLNGSPLAGLDPLLELAKGDVTRWKHFVARELRSQIPMSGAAGVLSQSIDNSLKNIHDDIKGYLFNRLPGVNATLPQAINPFEGKPINFADNPVLRLLSSVSPIPLSDSQEPYQKWLESTQWKGMPTFYEHSKNFDYNKEQQTAIKKYIGTLNLPQYLEDNFMSGPNAEIYKKEIAEVKKLRQSGKLNSKNFKAQTKDMQLYRDLDLMSNRVRAAAEDYIEDKYPEIKYSLKGDQIIRETMRTNPRAVPQVIQNLDKIIEAAKLQTVVDFNNN